VDLQELHTGATEAIMVQLGQLSATLGTARGNYGTAGTQTAALGFGGIYRSSTAIQM
jgi:hypothetical protein